MNIVKCWFLVMLGLSTVGCMSGMPEPMPPVDITRQMLPADSNGSIYQNGRSRSFFQDIKARNIGDVLTIVLVEQTSAQNSANSSLSRSQDSLLGAPSIGSRTINDLRFGVSSENEFNGQTSSGQSNSLNGNVTVTIKEVLPGGTLLVEGEKWIQINQSQEFVKLEGIVRDRDIMPNNMVLSSQVASARITYSSKGPMATAGRPAWGSRFFSRVWPF
jgi:flagellar L-ring protein FlgH